MTGGPVIFRAKRLSAPRFSLLDPLRGIAALWVFTFHYTFGEQFVSHFPRLHLLAKAGHAGVPVFFVISGFCLMAALSSAIHHNESVLSFLFRRAARIFGPLWFSVIVVALVPFAIEGLSFLKTGHYVAPTAVGNVSYGFLNYQLTDWAWLMSLAQGFRHVSGAEVLSDKYATLNVVYWSLGIEFQFYLVVAVALAFAARRTLILIGVTLVSIVVSLTTATGASGIFVYYWSMFVSGVGVYYLIDQGITPSRIFRRFWIGLGLLVLPAVFILRTCTGHPVGHDVTAVLFAFWIWLAWEFDKSFKVRSQWRVFVVMNTLGAMSYTLYLLHARLYHLFAQVVRQIVQPGSVEFDVLVLVVTCLCCYPFYRYIEAPFARLRAPRWTTARLLGRRVSLPPEG